MLNGLLRLPYLYTNLTEQAVLCAQLNTLQACFPEIQLEFWETASSTLSRNACVFEGYKGYALLPHCEVHPIPLAKDKLAALINYWQAHGWPT